MPGDDSVISIVELRAFFFRFAKTPSVLAKSHRVACLLRMVGVAQLVRAPDCGSGGRGFETRHPPHTCFWRRKAPRGSQKTQEDISFHSFLPLRSLPCAVSYDAGPFLRLWAYFSGFGPIA